MLANDGQQFPVAARVLIADNYPFFRRGIRSYLEEHSGVVIVGETDNANEALRLCNQLMPDILLYDLRLSGANGKTMMCVLRERHPEIKQVVFITPDDEEGLTNCVMYGVDGYVWKNASPDLILKAVRTVVAGGCWLQREMTGMMLKQFRRTRLAEFKRTEANLSERETEVMKLLAHGLRNQEIAAQLFISERTVKVHVTNIFDKLGVRDRVEAARYAIRCGMVAV